MNAKIEVPMEISLKELALLGIIAEVPIHAYGLESKAPARGSCHRDRSSGPIVGVAFFSFL